MSCKDRDSNKGVVFVWWIKLFGLLFVWVYVIIGGILKVFLLFFFIFVISLLIVIVFFELDEDLLVGWFFGFEFWGDVELVVGKFIFFVFCFCL